MVPVLLFQPSAPLCLTLHIGPHGAAKLSTVLHLLAFICTKYKFKLNCSAGSFKVSDPLNPFFKALNFINTMGYGKNRNTRNNVASHFLHALRSKIRIL